MAKFLQVFILLLAIIFCWGQLFDAEERKADSWLNRLEMPADWRPKLSLNLAEVRNKDGLNFDLNYIEAQSSCLEHSIRWTMPQNDGYEYRPNHIYNVYCKEVVYPNIITDSKVCYHDNLICKQRNETVVLSRRKLGQECWERPLLYQKPSGCHCFQYKD